MGEKGFTLIEMLLVVAIIGFLVAILVPSVAGFSSGAKDKQVKADLRQLKSAVEVYYISFAVYPDTANWGTSNSCLLTADGTSGYSRMIDQFTADPYEDGGNGNANTYVYLVSGDNYVIASDKGSGNDPVLDGSDGVTVTNIDIYVTNVRVITE